MFEKSRLVKHELIKKEGDLAERGPQRDSRYSIAENWSVGKGGVPEKIMRTLRSGVRKGS